MVFIRRNANQGSMLTAQTMEKSSPHLRFSSAWDLLGPFQIGTREASWGADPLEYLGGFRGLQYDSKAVYPSSLGSAGQVHWARHQASINEEQSDAAEVTLKESFPSVEWHRLQQVFGWAALQYQAWARGELIVEGDEFQAVLLYTDHVLEFWVDDKSFFGGDYYAYRRTPLVLRLQPGSHRVDIRIIRDVRIMGAMDSSISIRLKAERSEGGLVVSERKVLVSDVVHGTLASPFASLPVRNDSQEPAVIQNIAAISENITATMLEDSRFVKLSPGQSRPVPFSLTISNLSGLAISLKVTYTIKGAPFFAVISHTLSVRDLYAPHKVTFLHPSGIVSYAILRAPSRSVVTTVSPGQSLPIHVNLHGAGLESDSQQVRHMLDSVPDLRAFVLFPTGVTPWSGDDWHDWGFADVKAAIGSIPDWVEQVGWQGPQPNLDKWFISGHSNGGQGTLYALTHLPDKIIGASPVSGYLSIQKYVSYQMWKEADSRLIQAVENALQSFRHELLTANFKGIPVLQQHGSDDDNVATFHSRRLYELSSQSDQNESHNYVELEGKGHWHDGVMTTSPLRAFYDRCLAGEARKPGLPRKFQITVANPCDMGSRGGIQVDQLLTPDQLARIDVTWEAASSSLYLETSNVRRFHFLADCHFVKKGFRLVVDGQNTRDSQQTNSNRNMNSHVTWLYSEEDGSWEMSEDSHWLLRERHGSQLGPIQSVLRTRGQFHIRCLTSGSSDVALQISRNLYQYFGADSEIVEGASDTASISGNVITVALGTERLPSFLQSHPISVDHNRGIVVRKRDGTSRKYAHQEGLGVIFLRPLANERLELVIWGFDDRGLRHVARLIPGLTGVGQPDFVVVRSRMAWEGAAGALAMGSFNSLWEISEASFLQ